MKRFTVWIDHHVAHILEYKTNGIVFSDYSAKEKGMPSKEHQKQFYHEVAEALNGADKVLVLGPGMAKEEFRNHCEAHHSSVDKAIFKVESMKAHPSRDEILKFSAPFYKKYFEWEGT